MWSQDQLDQSQWVVFHDVESRQPLNVGTMEIIGTNGGIYLTTPVPPFGGLVGESSSAEGKKMGTHVPQKQFSLAYTPKGLPVPDRATPDQYVIHQYGDGSL